MADWLEGKKTYIAAFLVATIGLLKVIGVELPFPEQTQDAIIAGLGVVIMVIRMFTKTPGVAAK